MGHKDHRERAERESHPARCALLTVSDTRTAATDVSGRRAREIFERHGHAVSDARIIPNDRAKIVETARQAFESGADLVATLGGTGISPRDVSVEALRELVAKELPGFGEMFRARSAAEIGTAAFLSRAMLGITREGRIVVALPGSEAAVRLALEEILIPELPHLISESRRT